MNKVQMPVGYFYVIVIKMQQIKLNIRDSFEILYKVILYHHLELTLEKNKVKLRSLLSVLIEEYEL